MTPKIMKAFPNEEISLQHYALGYFVDLYFPKHILAIEVGEKRHTDRPKNKKEEEERQKPIKELHDEFIRINPDRRDFNIFTKIGKTHNHIIESTENLTKNQLRNQLKNL